MDCKLEVVLVPVSDVDRAKAFYTEQCGFHLDVDHRASDDFRVVQMTPPGSACSITIGLGITKATPGSIEGLHLIVTDIDAARAELADRGVDIGEVFHFDAGGRVSGRIRSSPTTAPTSPSATPTATAGSCRRSEEGRRRHDDRSHRRAGCGCGRR